LAGSSATSTDHEAVESMVNKCSDRWGRIAVLLTTAAYVMPEGENITEVPLRLFDQMFR